MTNTIYDVIIVGSGPAGMAAGIYTARKAMKTLIIGKDVGGQMAKTFIIENYPGVKNTDGVSLAFQIKEQVESFGVKFETSEVKKIIHNKQSFSARRHVNVSPSRNDLFKIITKNKNYQTKSIILAFGLEKRKLGIKNEEKYVGKGLSYCVTCDGPLFKNKNVAVVGGSNAGAEAVEFMAKICSKIYWIEVMDHLNADQIFQNRIKKLDNVETFLSTKITDFVGNDKLTDIRINQNGKTKNLPVDCVFVEIGYLAKTDWIKNLIELDKIGQIKVNNLCHTNVPGIFAAGDVTDIKYKQIVVAEGMSAIAGLEAYEYINRLSAFA